MHVSQSHAEAPRADSTHSQGLRLFQVVHYSLLYVERVVLLMEHQRKEVFSLQDQWVKSSMFAFIQRADSAAIIFHCCFARVCSNTEWIRWLSPWHLGLIRLSAL